MKEEKTKIKAVRNFLYEGKHTAKGQVLNVTLREGSALVASKKAVHYTEPKKTKKND